MADQVSSIIKHNLPPKYQDLGTPTISCVIGNQKINHALLDLRASMNLLPFSVYQQLGLGKLKLTTFTLQLADRSIKILRGILEDVLVQVDRFIFPIDFVVLDTEPIHNVSSQISVVLQQLELGVE